MYCTVICMYDFWLWYHKKIFLNKLINVRLLDYIYNEMKCVLFEPVSIKGFQAAVELWMRWPGVQLHAGMHSSICIPCTRSHILRQCGIYIGMMLLKNLAFIQWQEEIILHEESRKVSYIFAALTTLNREIRESPGSHKLGRFQLNIKNIPQRKWNAAMTKTGIYRGS